jgi:RNA polymerase sigma-70 factor (ECF subfamily)
VQETFLAALRGRKKFKGHSGVKTWLSAILKHKIVDCLRKKSREKVISDTDMITETAERYSRKTILFPMPT